MAAARHPAKIIREKRARDEETADASAIKKQKTTPLFSLPEQPRALMSANALTPSKVKIPIYYIVVAKAEQEIPDAMIMDLRRLAKEAVTAGTPIPLVEEKYDPFLHALKTNLAAFQKDIAKKSYLDQKELGAKLLSANKAGLFYRTAKDEVRREDTAKRCAGKAFWFFEHTITVEPNSKLLRADSADNDKSKILAESWTIKFDADKRMYQHYLLKTMRRAVKGLVALYGFRLFSEFTTQQLETLAQAMFDRNPLIHAMSMYAKLADTVDFIGIYAKADEENEESFRKVWRDIIRWRFIRTVDLIWTHILNVDPAVAGNYKALGIKKFQDMIKHPEHRDIMGALTNDDVPVHEAVLWYSKKASSYFDLQMKEDSESEEEDEAANDA